MAISDALLKDSHFDISRQGGGGLKSEEYTGDVIYGWPLEPWIIYYLYTHKVNHTDVLKPWIKLVRF